MRSGHHHKQSVQSLEASYFDEEISCEEEDIPYVARVKIKVLPEVSHEQDRPSYFALAVPKNVPPILFLQDYGPQLGVRADVEAHVWLHPNNRLISFDCLNDADLLMCGLEHQIDIEPLVDLQ